MKVGDTWKEKSYPHCLIKITGKFENLGGGWEFTYDGCLNPSDKHAHWCSPLDADTIYNFFERIYESR